MITAIAERESSSPLAGQPQTAPSPGEGGGQPPPQPPAAATAADGGEPPVEPPESSILVERVDDAVRSLITLDGEPFVLTLGRAAARAYGRRLIACAGDAFHRTRGA